MTSLSAQTILLVEDDEILRERLGKAFERRGLIVRTAPDGPTALSLAKEDSPELCVLDLRMPHMGGLEVLQRLREIDPTTRIVMLTGYGSIANAVDAMKLGAHHYVSKPADADEILRAFTRGDEPATTGDTPSTPSLARMEWEHINRVLSDVNGNISEAARRLGLHRRSLQRKLSKFPPRH